MMKVTMYKWHNLQAVDGWEEKSGFALTYCGNYGFIDCDNGSEYALPSGYTVAEALSGDVLIYDDQGKPCDIAHVDGQPVLQSTTRRIAIKAVA